MSSDRRNPRDNTVRTDLLPETVRAASDFRPRRAMGTIRELWRRTRGMDLRGVRNAAEFVAEELRRAELDGVTIEELPADGRTAFGGWLMPVPWTADEARLRALRRTNPALRLRARVRAARSTTGSIPLVTVTLGPGQPEVYLCAPLDGSGAQDNASAVGVAIEALRALQAAARRTADRPPLRAIRVFFSVDTRGLQAWINRCPRPPAFMAGLNLDGVGCEPEPHSRGLMVLGRGFPGQAHFAPYLLEAAARLADRHAGKMRRGTRTCGVSDALVGMGPAPGHVSLEQTAGTTYPTSADVPAILSARAVHWSGVAATAFLHAATRFDNRQALGLGRRIARRAADDLRAQPSQAAAVHARAKAELASLVQALSKPKLFGDWHSPAELYRAGVRRKSGCWPTVEDRRRLEALITALPSPRPRPAGVAPKDLWTRREAESLVPQVTVRGFLPFEDPTATADRTVRADTPGLAPTWAAPDWAWLLAERLRGKSTLADTLDELRTQGVKIELRQALDLTRGLVRTGRARLRPFLTPETLRRAFRGIGVRRGSVLCVHSSLSHFGYVPGGARTIVEALLDVLGPRGTLGIPTHSLSVLGAEPYDRRRSPSVLGAVSEYFLRHPGVVRSAHPTHSVAALGPAARALTRLSDPVAAPLARDGFWGKLYDAGGDVLLLCPIRSATIFHVGEAWTGVPQPALIVHHRDATGRRRTAIQPQAPWHSGHFQPTMADPLLQCGAMRSAPLGDGTMFFASARAMADISVAVNRANPLVSLGRNGACPCFYCQAVRQGMQDRSATAQPST